MLQNNHLYTFDTFGSKLVFVTFGTIDLVFFGNERFCSNRIFACAADEAFFMPLSGLILHFLHTFKYSWGLVIKTEYCYVLFLI